jgi:hypothetical protein
MNVIAEREADDNLTSQVAPLNLTQNDPEEPNRQAEMISSSSTWK